MPEITAPVVHLNGTSREALVNGYHDAWRALQRATEAFGEVEFNARDYYVSGNGAYADARRDRDEQLKKLSEVSAYLLAHLEALT